MATKAQLLKALEPFAAAGRRVPSKDLESVTIIAVGNGEDYAVITYRDLIRAAEVLAKGWGKP